MGTKGSYTGGGGAAGNKLRKTIDDWLNELPPTPPRIDQNLPDNQQPIPRLRPESLLPVIGMFRPATGHADGPGGAGGNAGRGTPGASHGGGAQRTTTRSANTAGRAAAAAFGLRTGNTAVLRELGLDYASLRANPDPIDVTRQIVAAACGPLPDGTIEDEEQRVVAAMVAEWILESDADGAPPSPEEVVREAITRIIFEAASSETAARLRKGERPEWASEEAERQLLEIAHALALRAPLSATGPTAEEFSRAIENGIEAMRLIQGAS
ncbi:hypothetical protein AB0C33_37560 [Nonomuraea sp. NPDC048881]|uniref:hypothetical protein n=1 Tax=Nonomuraea sp. NPDC048881 TaxID=3155030 RepID=UPI0033FC3AD8